MAPSIQVLSAFLPVLGGFSARDRLRNVLQSIISHVISQWGVNVTTHGQKRGTRELLHRFSSPNLAQTKA